nr:hypothetical protein Iba_chr05eCG9610 [Ipomoea batatas]GME18365.1 hypothetical protein Iba_scaffold20455CG0020 [Ipomoea batatas]
MELRPWVAAVAWSSDGGGNDSRRRRQHREQGRPAGAPRRIPCMVDGNKLGSSGEGFLRRPRSSLVRNLSTTEAAAVGVDGFPFSVRNRAIQLPSEVVVHDPVAAQRKKGKGRRRRLHRTGEGKPPLKVFIVVALPDSKTIVSGTGRSRRRRSPAALPLAREDESETGLPPMELSLVVAAPDSAAIAAVVPYSVVTCYSSTSPEKKPPAKTIESCWPKLHLLEPFEERRLGACRYPLSLPVLH